MFIELSITSNFTFLTGASHPEEYVTRAALLGMSALAIADDNSVAGIVRAYTQAKTIRRQVHEREIWDAAHGLIGPPKPGHLPDPPKAPIFNIPRLIPAARLVFQDAPPITVLPQNRNGWANLCRILSTGRLRAEKGQCNLTLSDLLDRHDDLHFILWPQDNWQVTAKRLRQLCDGRIHIGLHPRYDGRDTQRFERITEQATQLGLPTLASARPIMHHGTRRRLADVVTAIRTHTRVDQLGRSALSNAEFRLRSDAEMQPLFKGHEDALAAPAKIATQLTFCLSQLRYEYPSEVTQDETPQQRLTRLAHEGLRWRYPSGAPERVQKMLEHELTLISKLKYEPYFLTVRDVVAFARSRDILCQGRGSAANSVVCFSLGITSVSPEIGTMVF
ncbi:MAG: PHP domain-containing protein, partial [Paracoccaceae bacterium]